MMVRTYGRRSRPCFSDSVSDSSFKESSPSSSQQDFYNFSSQESTSLWPSFDLDPDPYGDVVPPKSKVPRRNGKIGNSSSNSRPFISSSTTLMEAQESGEMMEHVDEVDFALDGLRKGQPLRIRRASLLSLLSICGTAQQRRILRTQGMAKTVIDAILGLNFDDSSSNLAAAALLYILTNDGQDEHVLESPSCIHFLIKLLKPIVSTATEDKVRNLGSKLLALRKDNDILRDTRKLEDSTSGTIVAKVQEILISCKDLKSHCGDDSVKERPELSPKWIALLIIEKACLSKISLEDATGIVTKTGGNFKEKFRDLGGLDAVFEVVVDCHTFMEGWTDLNSHFVKDSKAGMYLQSLVMLLKCLKIMENATFLSTENQAHLLGMRGKLDSYGCWLSFTELNLSVIKILSSLQLLKSLSTASLDGKPGSLSSGSYHTSDFSLSADHKDDDGVIYISSSTDLCSSQGTSSGKSFRRYQTSTACLAPTSDFSLSADHKDDDGVIYISSSTDLCSSQGTSSGKSFQRYQTSTACLAPTSDFSLSADHKDDNGVIYISSSTDLCSSEGTSSGKSFQRYQISTACLAPSASCSETTMPSRNDTCQLKMRLNSSTSTSCSRTLRSSSNGAHAATNEQQKNSDTFKRSTYMGDESCELLEDIQDPFAFDEEEFQPSKWDKLSGKPKISVTRNCGVTSKKLKGRCQYHPLSQEESSNGETCEQKSSDEAYNHSHTSLGSAADQYHSGLLEDSLLSAIKVLMNLTNDNPIGCRQIAASGGLEAMSSLIVHHFPLFSRSLSFFSEIKKNSSYVERQHHNDTHLSDQELDLLVAILGLLVNLVEKDGNNRSRLALSSVSLPSSNGLEDAHRSKGVIHLLCSIFLANQGAGDASGEGNIEPSNDEAALLEGEKEAEKMIVEAYSALLLAFLSTDSKCIRDSIADCLPDQNLGILVPVLERFVAFHLTLNMIPPETHKAVSEVIESCRVR